MFKYILISCLFFLSGLNEAHCQNLEPIELAKRIFDKKEFPDINKYISGEYKGHPNGADFKKISGTTFLLLNQTSQKAVVSMTLLGEDGQVVDYYLFFTKDSVWKMEAMRSLALNGYSNYVKNRLEKLSPKQVDSIIIATKGKESLAPIHSRADYEFRLGNARLMSSSDEQLIKFFKERKGEFEKLKNKFADEKKDINTENRKLVQERWDILSRKLFISFVPTGDYNFKNSIDFVIGGVGDNTVGYVYINDKKNVPEMSADLIIMLRDLGNGWFLYKTT